MADKYYAVRFRVNQLEFSKFKKAHDIGISHKMIMQEFCKQCAGIEITVFNKENNKSITLPKGFLVKKEKK